MAFLSRLLPFGLAFVLGACSSESLLTGVERPPEGPPADEDQAVADLLTGGADAGPPTFVTIYDAADDASGRPLLPTALAWNPTQPDELWITLREPLTDKPCNAEPDPMPCPWLEGRVAIVSGATGAPGRPPQIETKQDFNAWHFMRRPSSLAWGSDDTFATCAEARTSNHEDASVPFNGPVLWSADPAIFAAAALADSPLGTHIDMMHESPYCMGIAHESANVYWTFNGDAGSLDRYDFHAPHEPGGDDHSDGEVWRYAAGSLERVPDVPSHLAYDAETQRLYAADTGHGQVVALDTSSGYADGLIATYDPVETHVLMSGATLSAIVPPGTLEAPTGLTLFRGVLFVTDFSSSRVVAFDRSGRTLASLDTGLPEGSLGGIGIGPDGRAYITDRSLGRVLRIEPASGVP